MTTVVQDFVVVKRQKYVLVEYYERIAIGDNKEFSEYIREKSGVKHMVVNAPGEDGYSETEAG